MPKDYSKDPNFNTQWNYYRAPGGPEQPAPPVVPPPPTRYSDKAFLHSWIAGAFLPLLQATITSIVIMSGTATFVWLIGGYEFVRPVVAAGVTTFVITWLALQFRWINLTKLEELTGLELDGRPGIGQQTQKGSVRVQVDEVKDNGHLSVSQTFNLSASPAQLKALCIGLHDNGMSLAEKDWYPLEEGKPFSIGQIRKLKAELIDNGIIVQANINNASLGYTETIVGSRIIEKWRDFDDDISMWDLSPTVKKGR